MTMRGEIRAELARRELARRSFADYLSYVHGAAWKRTRFSEYLAAQVQDFVEADTGSAYDILLIEAPPQHGKSVTVTESLPSWVLGRRPERRVILASYNDETAERFARRNREKLERFGRTLFGVELTGVRRGSEFELERVPPAPGAHGRLISRGILSGITGNPAELLLIDDPVKNRQEADSAARRRLIWEEWQNSLKSRLAAGAKVIVIMTPWHEDDLAGRLLKSEKGLRLLRLPVEAEVGDPLGRAPGAPLCPEIGKGRRWLAQFKKGYLGDPDGGARAWSALYQCAPRAEQGQIVRRDWWRRYDPGGVGAFGAQVISVDAAFKGGEDNDFVAIEVWAKRGNDYFCRFCLNRHLDFPQTLAAIRGVRRAFPEALAVLIEDKANGPAIISVLQREMFCIGVDPKGGKLARVHAVAPAIQSGHVFLPRGEPWAEQLIDQFSAFPAARHDDMVDSATQALSHLIWSAGEPPQPDGGGREDGQDEPLLDNERFYNVYD